MARKLSPENIPDGWKYDLLDRFAERCSGHTPSKSFPEYWNGGIKWVSLSDSHRLDQGYIFETESEISEEGIRNSSAELHPAETVLMSRDAGVGKSAVIKTPMAVSQHFVAWRCDNRSCLHSWFLYNWLQLHKAEFERQAVGSTIKTIGLPFFKRLKILVPPFEEQQKIVDILSVWDKAITNTERLVEVSQQQRHALMQQLLTGKRRLPGFTVHPGARREKYGDVPNDWGFVEIGSFSRQSSGKNRETEELPVLSCSKYDGFVDSLSYFNKRVYSEDLSGYKVIHRGDIGFPSNHVEEGSIGLQNLYDRGLVSPIYVVFRPDEERVDPEFLFRLLKTDHYRQVFAASTNASVDRRGSLRWKEFSAIKVPLPSLEEQKAIVLALKTADSEIEAQQQRLDCLRQEKKALMQQLLTGKRRVKLRGEAA